MNKSVVIIDDDELFRAGVTKLIDSFDRYKVKLSISTLEFLKRKESINKAYDLVLLTPGTTCAKGENIFKIAVGAFKPSPIMVFSNVVTKKLVLRAIESGISAYYTKAISPYDLEDIMNELTAQKVYSDIKLELKVREELVKEVTDVIVFTDAEEEVLKLVCEQKSSAEISEQLDISVRTVESRKRNMMMKTQSKNMIGVIMVFMRSSRQASEISMPTGR